VVLTPDELKKSSAGRKPFDAILMFRMLVLQALNNLSDEQVEYQVRDRLSFSRFLGLAIEDSIPDATTLWLFREKLAKAGLIKKLFEGFDQHLAVKGYIARGGQIIDASIVPVPTQRNSRPAAGWPHTGRVEAEARQVAAEGPRCALDQEAWPQLLRLQEPCERGRQAQADPVLPGRGMFLCKGAAHRAAPLARVDGLEPPYKCRSQQRCGRPSF
jgi:IS5 family transposase